MAPTSRPDVRGADTGGLSDAASRTSVILPALDDGNAIARVVADLRGAATWHEIIVVDDGRTDGTAERATAAGARVIRHPYRRGHGAAVKTGIRQATGEFVLMAQPGLMPAHALRLLSHLDLYELVVGVRPDAGRASGRLGLAVLTALASHLAERRIPDLTSGVRAARRDCLLEFLHLLPDGASTSTTTTLAFLKAGYSVMFVPLDASPEPSPTDRRPDDAPFFVLLLKIVTIFSPLRIFVPLSSAALALGGVYAAWTLATQSHVTNSSVLLILLSVVIFLVGLVSEQISALRFEGRRL